MPPPPTNYYLCPQRRTSSYDEVRRWCREKFLSQPTLERLDSLREQFRQQLAEVGFASSAVPSHRASGRDAAAGSGRGGGGGTAGRWRRGGGEAPGKEAVAVAWEEGGGGGTSGPGLQDPDLNSGNLALVQSVLVAGLYPHVAAFVRPDWHSKTRQVSEEVPLLEIAFHHMGVRLFCFFVSLFSALFRGQVPASARAGKRLPDSCVSTYLLAAMGGREIGLSLVGWARWYRSAVLGRARLSIYRTRVCSDRWDRHGTHEQTLVCSCNHERLFPASRTARYCD